MEDVSQPADTDDQRPPSLFHYTDAGGLLGILRDSKLWASDLRFLNDAQEAIYALELFKSALGDLRNPALEESHPSHQYSEEFGRTFEGYKRGVADELGSPKFPVYVTCFCESGDLLSQWRAYGTDHGYTIEFNAEAIESAAEEIPGYHPDRMLMAVRYGREAAVQVLSTALQNVLSDTNLGHVGVHAHYMALRLTAMLAAVKHPGFSEEREWRTVIPFESYEAYARMESPERNLTRFRSSSIAIVPYIEIPFPREAVVRIRVGPGRHADIRQQGVQRLLDSRGYQAEVLISEVPVRI